MNVLDVEVDVQKKLKGGAKKMIDELLESPAFWILGAGGLIAEVGGYIISKKMELAVLPLWQLIVIMAGTLVAAGFFALRE